MLITGAKSLSLLKSRNSDSWPPTCQQVVQKVLNQFEACNMITANEENTGLSKVLSA